MSGFTLDDLTLGEVNVSPEIPKGRIYGKAEGKFLKGPIPLIWLQKASRLPGKTLVMGITIWYTCGLKKSNTIKVSNIVLENFGIPRTTANRLLRNLEEAGLVSVERLPGQSPLITIQVADERGDTHSAHNGELS